MIFLSKNYPEGILLLEENQFEIIKLNPDYQTINGSIQEINKALSSYNKFFDFIIVDLFEDFDNQKYLDNLKLFCKKLFILSDEPKQFYIQADAVFAFSENQELFYYNKLKTKYYTGLKYFPLHSKFQEAPKKIVNNKVSKVLITFGGSDPNNFSGKLVSFLKQVDLNIFFTLILGAGYSKENYDKIMRGKTDIFIIKTNIKNMNEYLIETDVCICSAGNTVIEALACGVPCIVLPQTKLEYERAKALEKKELIINMGLEFTNKRLITVINNLLSDYSLRKKLSRNAQKYLDGNGIKRIVSIISQEEK